MSGTTRFAVGSLPVVVLAALAGVCWIWPGSIGVAGVVAIEAVAVFAASYMLGKGGRDVTLEDL